MKHFFSGSLVGLVVSSSIMVACGGLDVKIFRVDSTSGELVRKQSNEKYSCYDDRVEGYLCMSPEDFESILNTCEQ